MLVRVKLNLFGNATLARDFEPPAVWEGMTINTHPKGEETFEALYTLTLRNVQWVNALKVWRADAFPFGPNLPKEDTKGQIKLLESQGWKLLKKS